MISKWKIGFWIWLFISPLTLAEEVSWPVVPSATDRFVLALERACHSIGLSSGDIALRDDYLPVDSFRLSAFNRWIKNPLSLPGEFDNASTRLLQESWSGRIDQLCEWCDLESTSADLPGIEPNINGLLASEWKDRRMPVSDRRTFRNLTQKLPPEVNLWLLHLLQLDHRLALMNSESLRALSLGERMELQEFLVRLFLEKAEDQDEMEEEEIERFLELSGRVPWRESLSRMMGEVKPHLIRLLETPPVDSSSLENLKGMLINQKTSWGRLMVGGTDRQVYELEPEGRIIILDLGGDDVYRISGQGRKPGNIEYIVDLGGNDKYEAETPMGYGATLGGFSLLYDLAGDDRYEGNLLNFGVGLFGFGLIVDREGRDRYFCDAGSFGVGLAGIGFLVDQAGNDQYSGQSGVQGVGAPGGVGVLLDQSGDDLYIAGNAYPDSLKRPPQGYINFSQGFGFGLRPYCSGGLGVLVDGSGEDRYLSSYFAQGSCYWFGIGALCDREGNDFYETLRYSQGAGIHLGLGLLLDQGGHDVYHAWGVSQGCGHDLAVGILWDSAGDDLYRGSWLYGGSGNSNGFGFLIECQGNDRYLSSPIHRQGLPMSLGWGNFESERDMESLGFLLDLGGKDDYEGMDENPAHLIRNDVGVRVDLK